MLFWQMGPGSPKTNPQRGQPIEFQLPPSAALSLSRDIFVSRCCPRCYGMKRSLTTRENRLGFRLSLLANELRAIEGIKARSQAAFCAK